MGMRFNSENGRAVRCAAAVLAATVMFLYIGVSSVYADGLSAAEMDQQIAEQKAEEEQIAAQKEAEQQQAQDTVDQQIATEATNPRLPMPAEVLEILQETNG